MKTVRITSEILYSVSYFNMPHTFFHLPSEILCFIVEEYLSIWDVGKLDMACTNRRHRPTFLASLQNATIRHKLIVSSWNAIDNSERLTTWLYARRCGVHDITFSLKTLHLFERHLGFLNNKLKGLSVFLYDRCELTKEHYLKIGSCISLRSIFFDFPTSELDLIALLSNLSRLKHVHMTGKTVLITDAGLLKIGKMLPLLDEVLCWTATHEPFSSAILQDFQSSCKLLQTMYVNSMRIL